MTIRTRTALRRVRLGRRGFLQSSAGLFVTAGFFGCSSDDQDGIPLGGSLEISVVGLDPSVTSGGTAVISQPNELSTSFDIPAPGDGQLGLADGDYHVEYTAAVDHMIVGASAADITVNEGESTTIVFHVINTATGTLHIAVDGLPSGAPDGGTANVKRTDAGVVLDVVTIPGSGSLDEMVPAGTYHVVYTPPDGYVVSGVNQQDTVVAKGMTQAVSFAIR